MREQFILSLSSFKVFATQRLRIIKPFEMRKMKVKREEKDEWGKNKALG